MNVLIINCAYDFYQKKVLSGYHLIPLNRMNSSVFPKSTYDFQKIIYLNSTKLWVPTLSIGIQFNGLEHHRYLMTSSYSNVNIRLEDLFNQKYEYFGKETYSYLSLFDEQEKIIQRIRKMTKLEEIKSFVVEHPFYSIKKVGIDNRASDSLNFYDFLKYFYIDHVGLFSERERLKRIDYLENIMFQSVCHGLLFNGYDQYDFYIQKNLHQTDSESIYGNLLKQIQNISKSNLRWKTFKKNISVFGYLDKDESLIEIRSFDDVENIVHIEHHKINEILISRCVQVFKNHFIIEPYGYIVVKMNIISFNDFYGKKQ
jgi:hypothetical protein